MPRKLPDASRYLREAQELSKQFMAELERANEHLHELLKARSAYYGRLHEECRWLLYRLHFLAYVRDDVSEAWSQHAFLDCFEALRALTGQSPGSFGVLGDSNEN